MRLERDEDLYVNIGIEASEIVDQLERKAATCDCNIQRMLNQLAADALAIADGWDRGKLTLGELTDLAEELRLGYARVAA